jgi:hypothetical protein
VYLGPFPLASIMSISPDRRKLVVMLKGRDVTEAMDEGEDNGRGVGQEEVARETQRTAHGPRAIRAIDRKHPDSRP